MGLMNESRQMGDYQPMLVPSNNLPFDGSVVDFKVFRDSQGRLNILTYTWNMGFRETVIEVAGGIGAIASAVAVVAYAAAPLTAGATLPIAAAASGVATAADVLVMGASCIGHPLAQTAETGNRCVVASMFVAFDGLSGGFARFVDSSALFPRIGFGLPSAISPLVPGASFVNLPSEFEAYGVFSNGDGAEQSFYTLSLYD
jgi:hypothetical protein